MYSKILVPLDGSPNSERIVPYARSVAKTFASPVELIHVIHPDTIDAFIYVEGGRGKDVVHSDLIKTAGEYLNRVARTFPDSSSVQCTVEMGTAAESIIDRAQGNSTVLVAMSTRGYSGVKRWLLGSVAIKVLQGVKNPLLLVRTDEDARNDREKLWSRILVPLDGSGLAEKVLPHVAAMSKALNLHVELIQAYAPPLSAIVPPDYQGAPQDFPGSAAGRSLREAAERYLQEKLAQLLEAGVKEVSCTVIEGEAAQKIIETAQNTRGSLVAMCTHGRSGISRWVLGSVTERVLSHSGDPVLVIPAAAPADHQK